MAYTLALQLKRRHWLHTVLYFMNWWKTAARGITLHRAGVSHYTALLVWYMTFRSKYCLAKTGTTTFLFIKCSIKVIFKEKIYLSVFCLGAFFFLPYIWLSFYFPAMNKLFIFSHRETTDSYGWIVMSFALLQSSYVMHVLYSSVPIILQK